MPTSGQRRQARPILVRSGATGDARATVLARRPFQRDDIDEGWLQALVHGNPGLLAVEEIEPDYAPLIPIGREVPTDSGPIDNLFVNPSGLVTIVEAKLWRNPEARREVVAQILDYAEQVSRWSYEDLDERTRRSTGSGLWAHVVASTDADVRLEEDEFVDAVTRNLRRGRFLLLIVGDGIKESVEQLTEYVHRSPSLRFHLALVELRVYDMPDGMGLLVMPSVVARTQEVVRAVVDLRDTGDAIEVAAPEFAPLRPAGRAGRQRLDDEAFMDAIRRALGPEGVLAAEGFLEAALARGLTIDPKSASRMVKVADPGGSGRMLTLFGIHMDGDLIMGWLAGQTVDAGVAFAGSAAERYLNALSRLYGVSLSAKEGGVAPEFWRLKPTVIEARAKMGEFLRILDEYLAAIGHAVATSGDAPYRGDDR